MAVLMMSESEPDPGDPEPATPAPEPSAAHPEFSSWRNRDGVKLIDAASEGKGIEEIEGGVFGFTYTPHLESPLFRNRGSRSFEIHKLEDLTAHILGFVSDEDAAVLQDPNRYVEITIYPEPWNDADTPASVSRTRIAHSKGLLRDDGNALKLELGPENHPVN
jgi:hypothetical protein